MNGYKSINTDELTKLGSGSLSDVYLLASGDVLVVGKREDCYGNYCNLFKKSKFIDGKVSKIKYPQVHCVIEPCDKFKFGAMVESYVAGTELRKCISKLEIDDKVQIGKDLATFLNELHKIDTDGNKQEEININTAKFDKSVNMLSAYLPAEELNKLDKVKQDYLHFMQKKSFCVTHGDLNAGNILINDTVLSGIIDFGNMEYYVPEVEFAHMYFFDKTIYSSMKSGYDGTINNKDVELIELVMRVRHFKNIVSFEDKRQECLKNITELLDCYCDFK